MTIRDAIARVVEGQSLTREEAAAVMAEIADETPTPAQFGALMAALRLKGETADEIAGMLSVMRDRAVRVTAPAPVVDTCGTGGDGRGTFSVSTTAAFVVAGAGVPVAKHGNRAMSSACGSADVLEALGVKISLGPEAVVRCLAEVGMGFMFAQLYHPAMKFAAPLRREIGIRTVFNILGPLSNPAGPFAQIFGVADGSYLAPVAGALQRLGVSRALVVHGEDGVDELSITGPSRVCDVVGGDVKTYVITPEDAGLARGTLEQIKGGDAAYNARLTRAVLEGRNGGPRAIVLLNAAGALVAAGRATTLRKGAALAAEAIDTGAALAKLDTLATLSQRLSA